MNFPFESKVKNESETESIAQEFSEYLNEGDVITLTGELGSGKTFFVKSVCINLDITNVSSPSFAIVNIYDGKYRINHFDFYRIKKNEELYDIGFHEYINDEDAVTFIEWAEMFPDLLPKKYYEVNIELESNSQRNIIINKYE